MWIMSPIAWPTAKLLDYLLGADHGTMYKKAGLKTLVTLHKTLGGGAGDQLMEDEVTIINSVLDLKDKPVGDIMTPMQDVFTMSADTVLDERMMDTILSQGYSRIPIYAPDNERNFIGMLLVKILITYDPEDAKRVRDFALATLPETAPYTSCLDIINFFQEGKSHMVLVSDFPGQDQGALGVVTLEDVIEELIGEEIIDESDVFVDVHKAIRRMAPAPKTRFRARHEPALETDDEHDDGKEADENQPLLKKEGDVMRRPGLASGQTTFMMRRSSAASDGPRDKAVPVRSTPTDLREHLKHLGPSNAANKPKATKFTSVKIKPGVGTIPENKSTTLGIQHQNDDTNSTSPAVDAVEALKSNRPRGASGGVAAVYGTMRPPSERRLSSESIKGISAQEASKLASQHTSPKLLSEESEERRDTGEVKSALGRDAQQQTQKQGETNSSYNDRWFGGDDPAADGQSLQIADKLVVGSNSKLTEENDLVSPLATANPERVKKRMQARSGSITETTTEVGGMKKVVLETTSSSSSEADTTISMTASRQNSDDAGADENEDGKDGGATNGDGKKKRKKRGKKKKGANGNGVD
jgi:metal transporter CNNM